jgi:hypothetical protein
MTNTQIAAIEFKDSVRIERHTGKPMYTLAVRGYQQVSCVDWIDMLEEFERLVGPPQPWQWFMMRDLGDCEVDDE